MKQHLEEGAELRKYLLGELTLEESVSVEARLFLDDEYSSQLKAVEDELIDAYADDELTASERAKVGSRLLPQPGRREDLRLTRAIKRYVSDDPFPPPVISAPADLRSNADADPAPGPQEPAKPRGEGPFSFMSSLFARRPAVAYAFAAAAAVVILSAFIWFSLESLRGGGRPSDLRAQEPTPQPSKPNESTQPGGELQANQQPAGQGGDAPRRENPTRNDPARVEKEERAGRREEPANENAPTPRPATARVATYLILPGGVVRGPGGAEKVTVSSEVEVVILRLPVVVNGDYQSFRATLRDGGRVIHTQAGLKQEVDAKLGKLAVFEVPAKLLRGRRYEIKLGGVTADGQTRDLTTYTVPVERSPDRPQAR